MRRISSCLLAWLIGLSVLGCGKKPAEDAKKDDTRRAEVEPAPKPKDPEEEAKQAQKAKEERERKEKEDRERKEKEEKDKQPTTPEPKPYAIALVPPAAAPDYYQVLRRGAEKAAADLKEKGRPVTLRWEVPEKEFDPASQITTVDRLAQSGADGSIIIPLDPKTMGDALKRTAQKMPIILADRGDIETVRQEAGKILTLVGTNQADAGKLAAEKLLAALAADGKTEPKIVVLRYAAGAEATEQCEKGFLDAIKAAQEKGSKVKIVSEDKYTGPLTDGAKKIAAALLLQLGDGVDGFFVSAEPAAIGLLLALKEKNVRKPVVAIGTSEQLATAVRDGDLRGIVAADPGFIGYMSLWLLVRHLEGYDVGVLGSLIEMPSMYIDKSNVDGIEGQVLSAKAQELRIVVPPELPKRMK